jgi:hypothetical protein
MSLWVIEFRSGNYFRGLEYDHGGPIHDARKFRDMRAVDDFVAQHEWILWNGGCPIEVCDRCLKRIAFRAAVCCKTPSATEQKDAMTDDETKHAVSLAKCYLTGGDSPPLRADTTPTLAHAVLALHAEIEKMRPVFDLARRWCNRPEHVLRVGGEVFANDAELWIELRKRIAAATRVEPTR